MRRAVAFLLSVLLLTACTKAPAQQATTGDTATDPAPATSTTTTPATTPSPPPSSVSTIRVLNQGDPTIDALISAYQKKYPNDRVQKVRAERGNREITIPDLIKEMAQRGELDVVAISYTTSMAKDGLLLPLDPLLQQAGLDLSAYGVGLEALRYEGKLYELPYSLSPNLVVYNTKLFQAAGVEPPKPGWTWEQFRETAKRLTQGEGESKTWGIALDSPSAFLSHYIDARGGGEVAGYANETAVKEGLQLLATMTQTDGSMPKVERQETRPSITYGNGLFQNGKAAMTVQGLTSLAFARETSQEAKVEVAAVPMPVVPGTDSSAGTFGYSMAIAANTPNPEAAWRFVSFAAGPEGAEIVARMGRLPLYNTPAIQQAWNEQPGGPLPGTEYLWDQTWYMLDRSIPSISPGWLNLSNRMWDVQNAVMAGTEGWEDAFARYQQALRQFEAEKKGQ